MGGCGFAPRSGAENVRVERPPEDSEPALTRVYTRLEAGQLQLVRTALTPETQQLCWKAVQLGRREKPPPRWLPLLMPRSAGSPGPFVPRPD